LLWQFLAVFVDECMQTASILFSGLRFSCGLCRLQEFAAAHPRNHPLSKNKFTNVAALAPVEGEACEAVLVVRQFVLRCLCCMECFSEGDLFTRDD